MKETISFKRWKVYFSEKYYLQFANLFHFSVYHPKECSHQIGKDSKGLFAGRGALEQKSYLVN